MSDTAPSPTLRQPYVNPENQFFWDGVAAGELRIQRCADCGHLRHPPRPMCPRCLSLRWDSQAARGTGTVYSFVVVHQPRSVAFPEPYVAALIELSEGVRLVSNVIDVGPEDVRIGQPVQVYFSEVDPGVILPLFRIASPGESTP